MNKLTTYLNTLIMFTFLSTTLLYSSSARAFDWVTGATTAIKWIKDRNARQVNKRSVIEQFTAAYNKTHSNALSQLKFISEWQGVSSKASGIMIVVEKFLYLSGEDFGNKIKVDLELMQNVLSVKRTEALYEECKKLKILAFSAAENFTKDTFEQESLKQSAQTLESSCRNLNSYRIRLERLISNNNNSIATSARNALNHDDKEELEKQLIKEIQRTDLNLKQININNNGELDFIIKNDKGGPDFIKQDGNNNHRQAVNIDLDILSSKWIYQTMLIDKLVDIRDNSIAIQSYSTTHLNSLFISMKQAQIDFATVVNKNSDSIANINFPKQNWTAMVEEVLEAVK